MWANSIPGKRSNTIKYPPQDENHRSGVKNTASRDQNQVLQSVVINSTNQELVRRNALKPRNGSQNEMQTKPLNHTQQRRSFNFEDNYYSKKSKREKARYYDLQLAREALSYKLTTPLPQTVSYSYKKKSRRPKSYSQKSNRDTSFGYQPSSYGYQTPPTSASDLYPPLSYAQPSHQCKIKVQSNFCFPASFFSF